MCDRVALIDYGRLLAVESPRTLATWVSRYERIDASGVPDALVGVLEAVVATPAPFGLAVAAGVGVVTMFSLAGFAESWIVALVVFQVVIPARHPEILLPTLLAAAFAASGTALLFTAVFALRGRTRVFQNSITFPFYLLGGILPVAYPPAWLRPLSGVVFLS